ncbi:HAD-IIB family hydrolase [Mycoplasma anserisalpingitidis]|uniref:HAD family phosphatase n=1 Tax=Mycoplasma anserisalpingitidis TaxID=519450 RepID=A0A5B8K0M4_9MOLU|nr:HAD family hydrolase [Mycoplasma anserisalpingitidis]QDY87238.1 HAD family phosphatase [Mycoplasma anserisalpingitidis]QDY87862.1 HAD family phosphatase [Mycoplasma anserisalpingitidis]UCU26452.1 Cof-type HAD-IIB family hydrolase [Mycoplasma anserisalpingitidis]UCU27289.1 Cof-type HAD-IIB family hydrolase [Mycoplasma anserisalpingitidis]
MANIPKIFFVDLDGTLINKKNKKLISDKNLKAVEWINQESKFIITTGRSYCDRKVKRILKMTNSDTAILSSGAQILYKNQLIKESFFAVNEVSKIIEIAKKHKINFALFTSEKEYLITQNRLYKLISSLTQSKRMKSLHIKEINKIDLNKILKITFIVYPFQINKILKKLRYSVTEVNYFSAHYNWVIEITSSRVSKSAQALEICQKLNIDPHDCINFGDSMADEDLSRVLGQSVAMQNGDFEYIKNATFIAPHYKYDGFYHVVSELLNKKEEENN